MTDAVRGPFVRSQVAGPQEPALREPVGAPPVERPNSPAARAVQDAANAPGVSFRGAARIDASEPELGTEQNAAGTVRTDLEKSSLAQKFSQTLEKMKNSVNGFFDWIKKNPMSALGGAMIIVGLGVLVACPPLGIAAAGLALAAKTAVVLGGTLIIADNRARILAVFKATLSEIKDTALKIESVQQGVKDVAKQPAGAFIGGLGGAIGITAVLQLVGAASTPVGWVATIACGAGGALLGARTAEVVDQTVRAGANYVSERSQAAWDAACQCNREYIAPLLASPDLLLSSISESDEDFDPDARAVTPFDDAIDHTAVLFETANKVLEVGEGYLRATTQSVMGAMNSSVSIFSSWIYPGYSDLESE